ncbi:chitosanase [Streptomyces tagetis]|uniref:Chitosanase n=1 Tax=Streptomyces tagetis TaxID=2820809 RepID=A0A940XD63_9ACTN|nr:chitosanase [Streptomyces sp. RG38]MBQ0826339.1 chitosanase [Streptomyces sp. RG38]
MHHPSPDPAHPAGGPRRALLTLVCASLAAFPFVRAPRASADGRTGQAALSQKEIALRLVSSAENSSLDWAAQYGYVEDIDDGRGYTAGVVGFCSGTGDMLRLVELYARRRPGNVLAPYLPALRELVGSDSHEGLDPGFPDDWRRAARDAAFRTAQDDERDRVYFDPAVRQGREDGLRALGRFAYFDALVMHGAGGATGFRAIRERALERAGTPARGGDETAYLDAFLDARVWAMRRERGHHDTSRVDTAQRVFLREGNLDLDPPLEWRVYGDRYRIG